MVDVCWELYISSSKGDDDDDEDEGEASRTLYTTVLILSYMV
jgi:hypothetical protein